MFHVHIKDNSICETQMLLLYNFSEQQHQKNVIHWTVEDAMKNPYDHNVNILG